MDDASRCGTLRNNTCLRSILCNRLIATAEFSNVKHARPFGIGEFSNVKYCRQMTLQNAFHIFRLQTQAGE